MMKFGQSKVSGLPQIERLAPPGLVDPVLGHGPKPAAQRSSTRSKWVARARELAVAHPPLVFSSTCAVYGHPAAIPIRETAPQHPVNPYVYPMEGGDSAAFNLGTGNGHSVREVIAAVERISGRPVPRREVARRPGDPPELVADADLAARKLGWHAQCSDLETIVRTALAWHERHPPTVAEATGPAPKGIVPLVVV